MSKLLLRILVIGAVCTLNYGARADFVVPNSAAGVEADGAFFLTTTAAAGRTYQMTINSNQLTGAIGQQLTGFQLRLNGAVTANWPSVDTSWSFFDVYVGPGVDPAAMSNTFADNFSAAATQVRSGGLTITADSFTFGGAPNAFGPSIVFSTPYLYTGGHLTVEFRFSAQTGATNQISADAVTASLGPGNGWGVDFAARWTGNAAGTSGANGNFVVMNLLTQAVIPEPSSACILLCGLVALGIRRRR